MIKQLISDHKKKRAIIRNRLNDFKKVWEGSEQEVFSELCFCICTPQSKAVYCDKAIRVLVKSGKLFSGSVSDIRKDLKAVRFPNNKAGYIVETRKRLTEKGKLRLKDKVNADNIIETRDWLVKNVKGIGYKEASHFLRNVGFGQKIAILDVHILNNMVRYGLIPERPKSISRRTYLELEGKLIAFSKKVGIPADELDLVFWSAQTGEVFK